MSKSGSKGRLRRAMLARIHIRAKELGLGGDAYRATLIRATGLRTCADMNIAQLGAVLDELSPGGRLLWRIKRRLERHGRPPAYAEAILRRQTGRPRLLLEQATAAQLRKVLQALEIDRRRREARGAA